MIPRIEAAETLTAINRAALGAGAGEPNDRARYFAELERKASGEPAPAPAKADAQDLARMGIAITGNPEETPVIPNLEEWLGQGDQGNG